MGQGVGSKVITNGLVFSYDANSEKSYTGPPIQNMANTITASGSFTGASIGYTAGTEFVSVPTLGKMTVPYMEGYNSNSASYCCLQQFYFVTGNGYVPCSGSTQYTYGIVYRTTSGYTHANYMYRYEYNSSGTYVGEAGVHDDTKRVHLGDGWYWAWNTFTTQSTTARLYLRSFYYQYNVLDRHSVAKVLVTPGDYTGLHPRLWPALGTTKSSTATILDPIGKNTITANSLTYSNTGAALFNGTSSYLSVPIATGTTRTVCITYKLNNPGTGWGPLWRSDDWKERIFPNTITLINSNGTYYSLNGPPNNTSVVHIAYSYNGATAKSYLNGVLQSNITMDGLMNSGTYTYNFGRQAGGSTTAFVDMELYNVQFYDIQLTDEEVLQNFNAIRGRYGI